MSQFHSISASGMAIFDQPIESIVGSITVDLASAPITPGLHELHIDAVIGSVEIYLPKYVTFTVEGGAAIGGQDIHDGLGMFNSIVVKVQEALHLSNRIPARAVDNPNPGAPCSIKFVIDGGVGGIDIYRI